MARSKQPIPSVYKNIAIPKPLADRLDLELFSEVENRIPLGAYKDFVSNLILQYFEQKRNPCPRCNGTGVKGAVTL